MGKIGVLRIALGVSLSILFVSLLARADGGGLETALTFYKEYSLSGASVEQCRPILEKEFAEAANGNSVYGDNDPPFTREELSARLACLDVHSMFLTSDDMGRMTEKFRGNFGGIGANLKSDTNEDTVIIDGVTAGGAAERAGVRAGDVLLRARHSESSEEMEIKNVADAVSVLRGEVGSVVSVRIARGEEELVFSIIREKIKIPTVYPKKISSEVGYIQVTEHSDETADDFEEALQALKNEQGQTRVIVDMRDNLGGSLSSPLEMLFYFNDNPHDIALTIRERSTQEVKTVGSLVGTFVYPKTLEKKSPGKFKDYIVVILINKNSASASEVFAGTMQDWGSFNGRFATVGTTSFGKGVGQGFFGLPGGMGFKLTTFEFLVGNAKQVIQSVGVVPYLNVEDSRTSAEDTTTEKDGQFIVAHEFIKLL